MKEIRKISGLQFLPKTVKNVLGRAALHIFLSLWLLITVILALAGTYAGKFYSQKDIEYAYLKAEKTAAIYSAAVNNYLYKKEFKNVKSFVDSLMQNDPGIMLIKISSKDNDFTYTGLCSNESKIKKYNLTSIIEKDNLPLTANDKGEIISVRHPVFNRAENIGTVIALFDFSRPGVSSGDIFSNNIFIIVVSFILSLVITTIFAGRINPEFHLFPRQYGNVTNFRGREDFEAGFHKLPVLSGQALRQVSSALFKTRHELQSSQRYIENVIQSMTNSLIVLDSRRRIKSINKYTIELLGYNENELLGKDITEIMEDDNSRGVGIDNLIDNGSLKNVPAEYISKDGKRISVSFTGSVIYDDEGGAEEIICLAQNITERKEAEAAIIRAHDELELRVAQRTFELEEINHALKVENEERLNVQNKLQKSLDEKEVLLKEVHHRVKNNLQVISSLLQLNSMKIKDKESLEVFRASQVRIKSIAMVHERLYQSEDLGHIDIKDYIKSLSGDLLKLFRRQDTVIELNTNICSMELDIDRTVSLGLIINELVTNSLKYAFPGKENGQIDIEIVLAGSENYLLTYKDNGIGMCCNSDFSQSTSLGLRLITALTSQIDGNLEVESNNGVQFKITFPLKPVN